MFSNGTIADDGNTGLTTALSVGGFFGLLLLCSCCAICYRCLPHIFKDNPEKAEQAPQNPVIVTIDEDPS